MNPRERASLNPRDLPEYVERPSDPVWAPPFISQDVELFGFLLDADQPALDRLLQRDLCVPSQGAVDYRSASASVVVLLSNVGRLSSADPPDSDWGWMGEREVGIWSIAADANAGGRLVWYLPYLFTDTGVTVSGGREIYGYPKQLGTFDDDFPSALRHGGVTTVKALAVAHYGRDERAESLPMVSVKALHPIGSGLGSPSKEDVVEKLSARIGRSEDVATGPRPDQSSAITGDDDEPPRAEAVPHWIRRALDTLEGGLNIANEAIAVTSMLSNPTLVFLKQFRDIRCGGKACYQAVTEARFSVLPYEVQLLDEQHFEVTVHDWDSQPIATDVGVRPGTAHTPAWAFRAKIQFEIGFGHEVWRAPT